ncbi:cytochrome P450 [Kitasatospora sp. NPDC093102]|uniref:cytochrome P450 n=1 Tax=Kitasatospora sp. NPDC093102 TaxID=3155069 RepID=UPI0034471BF7
MGESVHTIRTMPLERRPGCPFDPPPELIEARDHGPISHFTFPGGKPGWIITGYDLVRSVLEDQRFSARKELLLHPTIDLSGFQVDPAAPGEFLLMDDPLHSRYRKLLAGKFTVRRMRMIAERVEQIVGEHLDAMEKAGPPVDLVAAYAKPIPAVVICELLGVPYEDRARFQDHIALFLSGETSDEDLIAAVAAVHGYIEELVAAKRKNPASDVISDLLDTDLTDEELRGIGLVLLSAGLDSATNVLALGTWALLSNPEQLAALRADPELADSAVEELLRYVSVGKTFMRTALEDVELGGQTIEAGTTVVLSYNTANRDPERFADPHALDLSRNDGGNLAFGHGVHMCLGSQLARIELRIGFTALVNRFPTLRLAVPSDEVPLRPGSADVHGVKSLPVTWDA